MGLPPPGVTAYAAPTPPLHPPMLRVNYGKLVTDSVSLKEEQPAFKPSSSRALGRLGATAGAGKPISRLDSTIARLRGSLGQGAGEDGPESVDTAGATGHSSSRLSPVERKVSETKGILLQCSGSEIIDYGSGSSN